MHSVKEKLSLLALLAVYLLLSVRYFPDQPLATLTQTLIQILSTAPFTIGMVIVLVSVLRRLASERLPWRQVLRIYLFFGIVMEFFFGLYDYLGKHQ